MHKNTEPTNRKWTAFFAVLSVCLLFFLIAALSVPKTQTLQRASQATTSSQAPQGVTEQPVVPQAQADPIYTAPVSTAPTSSYLSPTECTSDYLGGMNCTTSTQSGLQTKHCSTNYTGGYICE